MNRRTLVVAYNCKAFAKRAIPTGKKLLEAFPNKRFRKNAALAQGAWHLYDCDRVE